MWVFIVVMQVIIGNGPSIGAEIQSMIEVAIVDPARQSPEVFSGSPLMNAAARNRQRVRQSM